MNGWVHLNGALLPASDAKISVFDHGLLYGDGLFETLRVHNGQFFRLPQHLRRLRQGAETLEIELPWTDPQWEAALRETAAANQLRHGLVRLTVTRGSGPPVPDPAACTAPTYFITTRPIASPGSGRLPAQSLCLGPQHPRWFVPGIKSTAYLPLQLARSQARKRGFDDCLLVWRDELVETPIANVFAVCRGELLTPPLETGCLPGVTRAIMLELAEAHGVPFREISLPVSRLPEFEELFVTSAGLGIAAVAAVEGRPIADAVPGPVTQRLDGYFRKLIERETSAGWSSR